MSHKVGASKDVLCVVVLDTPWPTVPSWRTRSVGRWLLIASTMAEEVTSSVVSHEK